jgi:hypothetical protein
MLKPKGYGFDTWWGEHFDRLCEVRVPGYRPKDLGFDSRCYQVFWEVVGLERGLLSLVSSNGFGLESREYGGGDPLRWPYDTLSNSKSWH